MPKNKQKGLKLYKYLKYTIFALIAVILIGSILSFFVKKADGISAGNAFEAEEKPADIRGKKALYSDLGRLRISTLDKSEKTLVVFPVLEYNSEDKAFEEEIVQKKEDIRTIIIDFFSKKTAYELYTLPESKVKKELLSNVNSVLNLSHIKRVYFKEFVILE